MKLLRHLQTILCISISFLWLASGTSETVSEHSLWAFSRTEPSSANFTLSTLQRIDQYLENYDIRLRPGLGGRALPVGIAVLIDSFDAISEYNMDYTITLKLSQNWRDKRLAFSTDSNDHQTLNADFSDQIWLPDTFLANDKVSFLHQVTANNKLFTLFGDGRINYDMRLTSTLSCVMDLHNFPMDDQQCTIEVESYGYTMNDIVMFWENASTVFSVDMRNSLAQFALIGYQKAATVEYLSTGSYQRLSLSFFFSRNIGYFILQFYLPSTLIVILSWVTFWINHQATSARVTLGITTVLTMTTINTGVRSSLPRISYVKAIDIFLVISFVFVFCALIEYAAVNYTHSAARYNDSKLNLKRQPLGRSTTRRARMADGQRCRGRVSPIKVITTCLSQCRPASRQPPNRNIGALVITNFDAENDRRESFDLAVRRSRHVTYISAISSNRTRVRSDQMNFAAYNYCGRNGSSSRFKKLLTNWRIARNFEVTKIDAYSRILFPTLFILFNLAYWYFYLSQRPTGHNSSHIVKFK